MQNKGIVAIIGAMDCEVELLSKILQNSEKIEAGRFSVWKGFIGSQKVVLAKSGVGKVCAASCTQFIADKFSPAYVINTGIAGGTSENLSVEDVVIATELVQHDFDASDLGYAKGYMCTGVNPDKPTIYYADKELVDIFEKAAADVIGKDRIHRGIIASGDTFVGNKDKKQQIKKLFNTTAVEMEGAAIAQTCYLNNIPFVIVRAISDLADGTAVKSLEEFEYKTAQISSSVIKNLFQG